MLYITKFCKKKKGFNIFVNSEEDYPMSQDLDFLFFNPQYPEYMGEILNELRKLCLEYTVNPIITIWFINLSLSILNNTKLSNMGWVFLLSPKLTNVMHCKKFINRKEF